MSQCELSRPEPDGRPLPRSGRPAVLIIVAGLSVLAVHLVPYPWP